MENRELTLRDRPTPEQLYALEREARVLRSAEMARLLNAALGRVRGLFASRAETKGLRHA